MKAKVIQDGSRVVITFTGIENPEEFVEKIVKIVSGSSENEVVPQKVMGLVPVMVEENDESYEEESPKETVVVSKENSETVEVPCVDTTHEIAETPTEIVETPCTDEAVEEFSEVSKENDEIPKEVIETPCAETSVIIPKEDSEAINTDKAPEEIVDIPKKIEDFAAPYTGKTPKEIMALPNFEGFYFLCQAEIPERYQKECDRLLYKFAEKHKFFLPPFGNVERMKKYLTMAGKILGIKDVEDAKKALGNEPLSKDSLEALDILCDYLSDKIRKFFMDKK